VFPGLLYEHATSRLYHFQLDCFPLYAFGGKPPKARDFLSNGG